MLPADVVTISGVQIDNRHEEYTKRTTCGRANTNRDRGCWSGILSPYTRLGWREPVFRSGSPRGFREDAPCGRKFTFADMRRPADSFS